MSEGGYDITYWLDYAIERLEQGASVEEAIAAVPPAYREEVQELLPIVRALRQAPQVAPSPAFRARSRQRLIQRLGEMPEEPVTRPTFLRLWGRKMAKPSRRWAMVWITVVLIAALIGTGGTGAYAAGGILPGHPLYPVKLWIEDLQLLLAGPEQDAQLYTEFAERRVAEIQALVEAGRVEDVPKVIERWRELQARILTELDELPPDRRTQVLQTLLDRTAVHEQVLASLEQRAPEPARDALKHAYEMSQKWRRAIQHALEAPRRGEPAEPAGPPVTPRPKMTPPGRSMEPAEGEEEHPRPSVTPGPKMTPPGWGTEPAEGKERSGPPVTPGPKMTPPGWRMEPAKEEGHPRPPVMPGP